LLLAGRMKPITMGTLERASASGPRPLRSPNPYLVLYATRHGQTQRIAEHVATVLRAGGLDADVRDAAAAHGQLDLGGYQAAIVAASVHLGKHEREMVTFVKHHRAELERMPTAFLSVSLSEAGAEDASSPPERRATAAAEAKAVIDAFFQETGWHPLRVKPVAGALRYTKYNFLVRFVMKQIAKQKGSSTDTSRDHEFTDWAALDRFVNDVAITAAAA
jgi:menaquinone-dependent protoporphyrinogen oxidase